MTLAGIVDMEIVNQLLQGEKWLHPVESLQNKVAEKLWRIRAEILEEFLVKHGASLKNTEIRFRIVRRSGDPVEEIQRCTNYYTLEVQSWETLGTLKLVTAYSPKDGVALFYSLQEKT